MAKTSNYTSRVPEGTPEVLTTINSDEVQRKQQESQINSLARQSRLAALDRTLKAHLVEQGWHVDARIPSPAGQKWREIDAIFRDVGVEFHFAGYQALLSDLFVKYPVFLQANLFQIPVIVVPASTEICGVNVQRSHRSTFESTRDAFRGIYSFPLKYPFAILGISDTDIPLRVEEITSQMDQFLIESVGFSLMGCAF